VSLARRLLISAGFGANRAAMDAERFRLEQAIPARDFAAARSVV
jgi:hypothetical protein